MFNRVRRSAKRVAEAYKNGPPGHFLISPQPSVRFSPIEDEKIRAEEDPDAGTVEPTLISYGTRNTKYADHLARLDSSALSVGNSTSFETIPKCDRRNACLFKPTFIKLKLLTLGTTVTWLDADAFLLEKISLPGGEWDVGFMDNNRKSKLNEKASVCIAFRPTIPALRFIETWEHFCSYTVAKGSDHSKMNYTRFVLEGEYTESDITPSVTGTLIRDYGKGKEQRL